MVGCFVEVNLFL